MHQPNFERYIRFVSGRFFTTISSGRQETLDNDRQPEKGISNNYISVTRASFRDLMVVVR